MPSLIKTQNPKCLSDNYGTGFQREMTVLPSLNIHKTDASSIKLKMYILSCIPSQVSINMDKKS